jgi:uncharacterized membrane protein YbhN (UPF0104 family)
MSWKISRPFKTAIILVVVMIIFFFMAKNLYRSWPEIKSSLIGANKFYILLSLVLLAFSSLLGLGYAWFLTLRLFNERIRYWQAVRTSAVAQFGKYLPGKVWTYGGRIMLAKVYGVSEIETATALLIETVTNTASAVVLFSLSLLMYRNANMPVFVYLSLIFVPISFIMIHPRVLESILGILARIRRQKLLLPSLNYGRILKIYLFYLISWIVHTLGFYFLTNAIYPVSPDKCLGIMGAYAISWTLGFFVFLIPGGFGVREGLLTFFLKFFMPLPFATFMAFVGRFWTTIGELLYLLVSLLKKP